MANIVHFRGGESLCEVGFQGNSLDTTSTVTAVTPVLTLTYLQNLTMNLTENVESHKFVNGGNGRNRTHIIKGETGATFNMGFWIPKDLDQATPMEVWLLKMGLDGTDSKAEGTPDVYTIPDSADEFGDDYLKVMTIEAGYNKSSNIINARLTGAIVNTMTVHAEAEQPVLVTLDGMAAYGEMLTTFSAGSLTEASENPFRWGDCDISYGDATSPAAFSGVTTLEFSVSDNVERGNKDLTNSSGTPRRYPNAWILNGMRTVSGTITLDMTTATHNGQDLYEDLFNDASGTATPTEGVVLKDLQFTMNQDATYYIRFYLHDVVLGEIPHEVTGSGVQKRSIPFTATACVLTFSVLGTSSAPTGWAE